MLLPSDVARLVLGYLQEEGLSATSQSFIHESPNLKEYAEHTTVDGTIPACVFSIFGKGLTTILNEYVAAKTKESCHEVPAMMTSLWKKLDFTLNQIKSLQNSPAISASQRTRSRVGLANMARQRVLAVAPASGVVCSTVSETVSIFTPTHTSSHCMISHSTPVTYTRPAPASGPNLQNHEGSRLLNTPRDSSIQIVSEQRLNPGPVSPGRRKWKRTSAGSSGTGRSAATVNSLTTEPQAEEQLVIQNARDKILGDRSLQEKLAENINKILANEPTPQTPKASSNMEVPDQSIDEILGLQGEIHMSDDAIHDILEQTESDPAFQALFDLFDYNKTRDDGEPGDGDISSSPEESDAAGPSFLIRPLQSDDPGTLQRDGNASDTTLGKMKAGQERKTRKSTGPTLLKKVILGPSNRASRIENSSAKLLVMSTSHEQQRGVSSADGKEKGSLLNNSFGVSPMDIDEPLNTPPPPSDSMDTQEALEQASNNTPTTTVPSESVSFPSSRASVSSASSEAPVISNVNRKQESKRAQGSNEQPVTSPALTVNNQCSLSSPAQLKVSYIPTLTPALLHMSVSSSGGNTHQVPTHLEIPDSATSTSLATATVGAASVLPSTTTTAAPGSPTHASTSATPTATAASSTTASPAPSSTCAPAAAGPDAPSMSTTSKAASDSGNIVSLKIIISDNQEEDSVSDTALSQAISSISGDKIPTIYLSSPAKTPAVPGTPKASLDEVAQAVSGLQSSEAQANLLSGGKTGAVISSPLTGISQAQQSYIIQVPLDTTNPSTASYFLVTEHPTSDAQGRQKLVPAAVSTGQPLSPSHFGVNTPPRSQGFSPGPALILPSPVKPVVLPVSVMGQNPLGKVQMVSNQLVAIPNPLSVQQPETTKPKQSTTAGAEQTVGGRVVQSLLAENTGQQNVPVGTIPSHRRILCFDSSGEVQQQTTKRGNATASAPCVTTPRSVPQTVKDHSQSVHRAKPAILGGNKPKRRIETVRCSDVGQPGKGLMKEPEKSTPPQQNQKDAVKKSSRKQDHTLHNKDPQSASSKRLDSPQSPKKSESGRRSKSTERKHNHGVDDDGTKAHNSQTSGSGSTDSPLKSGGRKDKEESSRKEPSKTREGRSEKRTASQEIPNVTANKENEMKGSMQEQQSAPSTSGPSMVSQPTSNPQSKITKPPSKTSSLAKQAAEMLQDIQGLNSPSTPRGGAGGADHLPRTPGTGRSQEESADSPRTPARQSKDKDAEGTPKRLVPPNTSDVPTCSPASEAGSENSINMAAHTLMILSRAAIARTGTPLKDSLRQEGVAEQSPSTSKMSKKRKLSSPTSSPPAKKESKRSPSKKKDRERKKLVDCFPHDLDVEKFLSSLHYDE